MIEFVGSKEILDFAREEGFETIRMTFEDKNAHDREAFNVFEVSEEEFEKMCNYEDDYDFHVDGEEHPVWKDTYGWWRYSGGCNLDGIEPFAQISINNHTLNAWIDGTELRKMFGDYSDIQDLIGKWVDIHGSYNNIFDYCLVMWGASTEHNVTAIAVGLAKLNNMSLANLFSITT